MHHGCSTPDWKNDLRFPLPATLARTTHIHHADELTPRSFRTYTYAYEQNDPHTTFGEPTGRGGTP